MQWPAALAFEVERLVRELFQLIEQPEMQPVLVVVPVATAA